jgi:6-phosphogluconolactonase
MSVTEPGSADPFGMPGGLRISPTAERAAAALADRLVRHLTSRLQTAPAVHLALSGGSSGALFCDELANRRELSMSEWLRIHVWMVDERCVPDDDPRLNFALIRDRLAPRVPVPSANLHPMPVLDAHGAATYQAKLASALAPPTVGGCLDAVVLGMGSDGHTASLFPRSPALGEKSRMVVVNDGDMVTPPRPRMTLTFPTLNSARLIAVLATGASKRPALAKLAGGANDLHSLPIAGILPGKHSELAWFVDVEAAPAG